jgi:hypothetical protein
MLVNGFMNVLIVANFFPQKKEIAVFFALMGQCLVRRFKANQVVVIINS